MASIAAASVIPNRIVQVSFPSSEMGTRTPRRTPPASVYATTLSSVTLSGSSPASRFARNVSCVRLPSVLLRTSSTSSAGSLGGNQTTVRGASFQLRVTVTVPLAPSRGTAPCAASVTGPDPAPASTGSFLAQSVNNAASSVPAFPSAPALTVSSSVFLPRRQSFSQASHPASARSVTGAACASVAGGVTVAASSSVSPYP